MSDEWQEASESGNVTKLKALMKAGLLDARAVKVQNCAVAAALAGHGEAVEAFIDWGVQPTCQDKDNKRLMHSCIRKGLDVPVAKLIAKRADVSQLDGDGGVPIVLAIKNKHLGCARELLRAGISVPPGLEMPGLANVIQEVTIEKGAEELRKLADVDVDPEDITKAENEVSKQMKEHMRLLKLREDAKAAKVLVELERQAAEQEAAATGNTRQEAEVAEEVTEKKILVRAADQDLDKILKELAAVQASLAEVKDEDAKVQADLAEKKKMMKEELTAREAIENARKEQEQYALDVQKELADMEAKVEAAKMRNENLGDELQSAKTELRSWLSDREKAAELTAQAHKLLGLSKK